jgi:hypothetical protein
MLKANMATVDALILLRMAIMPALFSAEPPPTGMLQPFHDWMRLEACGFQEEAAGGNRPPWEVL